MRKRSHGRLRTWAYLVGSAALGLMLGFWLVRWAQPTTLSGVGLLLALPTALCLIAGGVVSWLFPRFAMAAAVVAFLLWVVSVLLALVMTIFSGFWFGILVGFVLQMAAAACFVSTLRLRKASPWRLCPLPSQKTTRAIESD